MICYLYEAPKYFFFTTETPDLLYYSHIPAVTIALLVGSFVYLKDPKILLNKLLFLITICFSLWTLVSLVSWTNVNSDLLLFAWTFYGVFFGLISVLCIYFSYVFTNKKDVPLNYKLFFILLLLPILMLGHTNISLSGFNLALCDAFEYEGLAFKLYTNLVGALAVVWIALILIKGYLRAELKFKQQILLMGFGIELFLFSFFSITFFATYLVKIGIFQDSRLEMYGLFGMTIFMVLISVMIVKFKTFNVSLIAPQALVIALIILTASKYTFSNSSTDIALTTVTLFLTSVAGLLLVRSVRKEIKQRKELETLTGQLEKANLRLKELDKLKSEFVSIASHQLRSPITAIRGYTSLLLDGDFGKMPAEAKEPLERIEQSSKRMAMSIEDYLNVSRIESGNMKYNYSDFSLRNEVEKLTDDMRPEAIKKGLTLLFRTTDLQGRGMVHADIGKAMQIVQNLINNAIKYTPKGSISVYVRDDASKKKVFVDVVDTGVGIDADELETVFIKFERARNANAVNAHGTGLGLFVAIKMAKAMDGDIIVHSDGEGKGSRFTVELPLAA